MQGKRFLSYRFELIKFHLVYASVNKTGICSSACTVVIFIFKIKFKSDFKNNWRSMTVGGKIAPVTKMPKLHSFSRESAV